MLRSPELSKGQPRMGIFMSACASALMLVAAEICIEDGIPEELFHDLAQGAWKDTVRELAGDQVNERLN
jgi:hypothetical protein